MFQMDIRPKVISACKAARRASVRHDFLRAHCGQPEEDD